MNKPIEVRAGIRMEWLDVPARTAANIHAMPMEKAARVVETLLRKAEKARKRRINGGA